MLSRSEAEGNHALCHRGAIPLSEAKTHKLASGHVDRRARSHSEAGFNRPRLLLASRAPRSFRAYWFKEFAAVIPGTEDPQAAEALVEQLVLDHWLLKRAQRNYISVEYELSASEPMQWHPGDERKLQLMIR